MAPDSNNSSPKSAKSDTIKATKEDAATTATREELRNTSISGAVAEKRAKTPESESDDAKDAELKDQVSSPKKKRAHDEVDDDKGPESGSSTTKDSELKDRGSRSEPEKKRHRDEASPPTAEATDATDKKTEAGEAAGRDSTKDKPPATSSSSSSAFSQSGFSKLTQTTSPFGALAGSAKGSVFGKAAPASSSSSSFGGATAAPAAAPTLTFNQAAGASPFGTLGTGAKRNGFGGGFGGGGFASPFGSTAPGKLSSFAKPGETFGASTKSARPFGAPDSDAEEDSGDDDEDTPSEDNDRPDKEEVEKEDSKVAEEKKKRLQMVEVNDGEAGEVTILQVRAKMYYVARSNMEAGWKERGAGVLKINVPANCVTFDESGSVRPGSFDASGFEDDDDESATSFKGARLIMRQDNTHKLLLNTALLPAMKFQEKQSLKTNTIMFTAFESAKDGDEALPVSISMKMSPTNSKLFLGEVSIIQRELQSM